MKSRIHRRSLAVGSTLVLSLSLAACGGGGGGEAAEIDLGDGPPVAGEVKEGALEGITMSFASYGGIYQDGQMKSGVEPFAEISGAEVLSDGPTDYAKIQAQVESGNVTWDVVDTGSTFALAHCGELFMEIDTDIVDTSNMPEELVSDCAVPAMAYAYVMMYSTDTFGSDGPQSWDDFFDIEKFPGKRGVAGIPSDIEPGLLEGALIADGVKPADLYPLDVDRALDKLGTIREHIVFWDTGARAQQLIESGEVDINWMWSGRALAGVQNGAKFEANWNDYAPVYDTLTVPKGARNPKASMALINFMVGPEQQAKLTELTSYAPIHADAKPELDELTESFLVTSHPDTGLPVDSQWWAENQSDVIEKWSAWLGG